MQFLHYLTDKLKSKVDWIAYSRIAEKKEELASLKKLFSFDTFVKENQELFDLNLYISPEIILKEYIDVLSSYTFAFQAESLGFTTSKEFYLLSLINNEEAIKLINKYNLLITEIMHEVKDNYVNSAANTIRAHSLDNFSNNNIH